MEEFNGIKITGLNVDATSPSASAPAMRRMHLTLSRTPPPGWEDIFNQERQFPRHNMWRHAWVQGSDIVVDCVPDEIEKHHLADLKQDVENTNSKYNQQLTQTKMREQAGRVSAELEKSEVKKMADRLKFD